MGLVNMKSFSILVLSWMAIGFTSGNSFNEQMPPRPLTDTPKPKLNPKVYFLPSRETRNKKLERIIHLMHLMELSCLERFAKPVYYENRFGYQKPFKNMKPLRRPAIRNYGNNLGGQVPFVYSTKQNQFPDNRRYFGNSRVIFVPPLVKVTGKRVNLTNNVNESKVEETLSSNKGFGQIPKEENKSNKILETNASISQSMGTPQSGSRTSSSQKQNEKKGPDTKEDVTYIKILPPKPVSRKTDEKLAIEFPRVLGENPESPKSIISEKEKLLKFPERPSFHEMKSKPVSNFKNASWHFLNHSKPNQIQQYEVEEIIEEKVSIDLRDKDDEYQNLQFGDKTNEGKLQNKDTDFISKSINSVLKSLIHSDVETSTEKIKISTNQKINTWPSQTNFFTSASPRLLKTFSNQRSESFLKKANENKPPFSREKQTKSFEITSSYENRKETTAKIQTEVTDSTTKAQYTQNAFTTGLPKEKSMKYTTQNILKTEENSQPTDLIENLLHKTSTVPETSTQKTTQLSFSDIIQDEPNQSSPFVSTSQETISTKNEDFKTFSDVFEIPTTVAQKSTNTDATEFYYKPQTASYTDKTDTTVNERDFENQKLTNQPINFDLITVAKINSKKDKEAVGRKINFDEITTESPRVNFIPKTENEEQRRSDILITENLNDYLDVDNNLPVSYWSRMLQENLTSDSIIPLIPVAINDLREGRISGEDMSILPEVFGKYWTTVVVLANNTNLDMLPFFKMKNEEDLKQVLQNIYPEFLEITTPSFTTTMSTTTSITTSTTEWENRKDNNYESYDYLDEYKDLYGDVLESEIEKNEKKQKDIRVKRDEEEELQKIEATLEYFESIEEEQKQKDNEPENAMYGEMSEDEDTNALELTVQVAGSNINLRNITSPK